MSSQLYKKDTSENWWIDVRHNGQRIRRSTGTDNKIAAQEYLDRVKADLWRQARLGDAPEYTWNQAVTRWVTEHVGKADINSDKDKLRWLSRFLAGEKLSAIGADRVEELIKARQAEPAGGNNRDLLPPRRLSDTTVNRYMSALSAVMNCAVAWGWIPAFPKIRKLKEPKVRVIYLTPEEANALITELPMHLAEAAAFSLATGLRENNVLELEWRNIDMRRRVAWVHGDETKNEKPLSVPLDENALAVLRQREAAAENLRYVFSFRGAPVQKASTAAWYKALARVEAFLGRQLPAGFKWHGLRHTWASWHVMSGTPLEVLQVLGGWSDLRMVQRYAHLAPGHVAQYAHSMKPMGRSGHVLVTPPEKQLENIV